MKYQKINFRFEDNIESLQEILPAILAEIGFDSFEETSNALIAYCPDDFFNEDSLRSTLLALPIAQNVLYRIEEVPDTNWNEVWEENQKKPIIIEDIIVHRSDCIIENQYKYEIIINPKMAFGTGSHETTRLILKYLQTQDLKNKSVLDMGCGTAVLSILASKRGADSVIAIDIDPWSQENAEENVELNECNNIRVLLGDATLLHDMAFDTIFANINRNILLEDMPSYVSVLNSGGKLILSGFYSQDIELLEQKGNVLGLSISKIETENDWALLEMIKK